MTKHMPPVVEKSGTAAADTSVRTGAGGAQHEELQDLLDSFLALEDSAKLAAASTLNVADSRAAKQMAAIYAQAAAAIAELHERKTIAEATRTLVPFGVMQTLAYNIVMRAGDLTNVPAIDFPSTELRLTGQQLHDIIMEEFDKELG